MNRPFNQTPIDVSSNSNEPKYIVDQAVIKYLLEKASVRSQSYEKVVLTQIIQNHTNMEFLYAELERHIVLHRFVRHPLLTPLLLEEEEYEPEEAEPEHEYPQ